MLLFATAAAGKILPLLGCPGPSRFRLSPTQMARSGDHDAVIATGRRHTGSDAPCRIHQPAGLQRIGRHQPQHGYAGHLRHRDRGQS